MTLFVGMFIGSVPFIAAAFDNGQCAAVMTPDCEVGADQGVSWLIYVGGAFVFGACVYAFSKPQRRVSAVPALVSTALFGGLLSLLIPIVYLGLLAFWWKSLE